jgi:hypothetical protein
VLSDRQVPAFRINALPPFSDNPFSLKMGQDFFPKRSCFPAAYKDDKNLHRWRVTENCVSIGVYTKLCPTHPEPYFIRYCSRVRLSHVEYMYVYIYTYTTHTHTHTHTHIYIYICVCVFNLKVDRILMSVIYLLRFTTCYITQLTCIYSKCWK